MNEMEPISLKAAEHNAFTTSAFQDGLWDLMAAYVALEFALLPYVNLTPIPLWLILLFAILGLRAKVVRPRLGSVQYSRTRMRRLTGQSWVMLALGVAALVAILISWRYLPSSGYAGAVRLGLVFVAPLWLIGWFLAYARLYVYGGLLGLSPIAGEWLSRNAGIPHHGITVTFGFSAAVIAVTSLVLFVRVLRLPRLDVEMDPVENG
jgi:hypothetical protein